MFPNPIALFRKALWNSGHDGFLWCYPLVEGWSLAWYGAVPSGQILLGPHSIQTQVASPSDQRNVAPASGQTKG